MSLKSTLFFRFLLLGARGEGGEMGGGRGGRVNEGVELELTRFRSFFLSFPF